MAPSFLLSTLYLLALVYVILAMPFAYRSLDAGLRAVDLKTLTEASNSLGAGWFTTLLRVVLPNLKTALLSAIAHCGGQAALARALSAALETKISQQRVWNTLHRDPVIPAEWCLAIEQATGGAVSRHALRPDLYPEHAP